MSADFSNSTEKSDVARNLELYTCVWLDSKINETEDSRVTEQELRRIINHLYTCTNEKKCEKYIRNIIQEKVVLIVSGTIGKHIIPRIHDLSQLSACYIFCGNTELHKSWAMEYSKVKGVFDEIKKLVQKLSEDQSDRNKFEEGASISVISHNSKSVEERNAIYMWFQLYIEVLIRMHHKLSDRKELLDLCKNTCKGNQYQLDILNEFEKDYKCEQAIWWYTRESCLYRILNKALRFQDYDTLFAFRFLITDIAKQLKNEYEKFIRNSDNRQHIYVYRGQIIGNNELELMKNNIGEYLSMNSFFSTSLNRSIALHFLNSLPRIDQTQQRILFEIEINPKLQTKPFVNVKPMSFYRNEDEILIMLGAFFQIKKLVHDQIHDIWFAYLSLADENENRLKDTFAHMKQKIGEETNLASLGKILFEMGEYDQVEKCYQRMMYNAQIDLSSAHSGLGKAALGKKNFSKAVQCEQESLQIKTLILPKNHRDLAISYSRLGDIYCKLNDPDQALKYLKKAGRIQEKLLPSDPLILAKTYHRIALTCVDMDNYDLAMEFFDKTLQIRKDNLPAIDKSIASTYYNIGKLHYKQKNFTRALKFYNEALDIYKRVLPPKHPDLIEVEKDIKTLKKT